VSALSETTPLEILEPVFIPLADGTRLAARIWRPADALARPVPAILEYIPYRLRDGTRGRDGPMHRWFAENGYAAVRVDMRGSGESDGFLEDEYLRQEQDDALEVIAWIADQPWCDGGVGMMGKSWGGFNALQVAARRPPALKAIVTVYSTDDRFADDIHFMGGCLLNDNQWWGSIMLAYQARPLDPAVVGTAWRERWLERLDRMPFWPALWLAHQRRDAYWRHGSVNGDWSAIAVPVLAIGGWADAYTNAVPRLLENLKVPRRGIIGPWAHVYPHDGVPGPAIGFLQEAKRWWDTWLKGEDAGVTAAPMLVAYLEDWRAPATTLPSSPGRWVGEADWPSPRIAAHSLPLSPGQLGDPAGPPAVLQVRSPATVGLAAGEWMGAGVAGEMPADQRLDDAGSLVFDTAPLGADLDILGFPVAELTLSADGPIAQVAVRLSDVAPDGAALRVSYAVLNLAHRDGPAEPKPLVPGEPVTVSIPLKICGHRFPAGHRVRLSVSSLYWPLVWPSPTPVTLSLSTAGSRLLLPVRPADPADAAIAFPPPSHAAATPVEVVRPGRLERRAEIDLIHGVATYVTNGEGGVFGEGVLRFTEVDTVLDHALKRTLTIPIADPSGARSLVEQSYEMGREGWRVRIETRVELTADATHFRLTGELFAFENGVLVRSRSWDERIARDHL
jgi:putative CocE/NonD family hydrolase